MEQDKEVFFTMQFDNWVDFEAYFKNWCNNYYQPVNIKRHSMKYNEKTMKELFNRFRYGNVKYVCHHSGPVRRHLKDGSRPNQESARMDCPFYFKIKHDTELNKIVFLKNRNLFHNHPIEEIIYKKYTFIRNKELEENEQAHDLCQMLITANASTYNNRKIIHEKFAINLTRKDVNNFKQKIKFNLIGNQSDPELLHTWIDEILNENSSNSIKIKIKINENGTLECLYIQTVHMKEWFDKYSNILHIDSTLKINIENYQLFICLVQNANLKGVPVAYCLMTTGNKDNLEFFYSTMSQQNDLTQTQVVMVDKDLTNIDILQEYFRQARILLCIFHVLKYLKIRIHELKIPLTNRMNIMKNIRKLLYDNNQMSAIYLKEIKNNSEGTDFYNYFEINWLTCCERWQTQYRKNLFNFNTDTNNHLERFNRKVKDYISPNMHISECVKKLIIVVEDAKAEEINTSISLKRRIYNSDDSNLLKRFGFQITNKAIELLRKQKEELKHKCYFVEEIEENKWTVGQKDEENKNFITSSIIDRNSCQGLFTCDCQFHLQNQLPCRHMIVLLDRINDEIYDHTNEIQEIISINKRWLKSPTDYYLNEMEHNDILQNHDSQLKLTEISVQKNKILSSNDKYNMLKPTMDLLTARLIQCGTNEFNEHLNFLNVLVTLINTNKHKDLYNCANPLTSNCAKKNSQEMQHKIFTNLPDDMQKESTAKFQLNFIEVEKESKMELNPREELEQDHGINFSEEKKKQSPTFESNLEPEANEVQDHLLSKNKMIFSYSPVAHPPGRPRGKTSLVAYKQKDKRNNEDKTNKKRSYKQLSPDIKTYNYKRNKKVDSVRDVYDKTTWLTDFHIYLFFELLHEQFLNINESFIEFFKSILPDEEKVIVSFENVQQQVGGNDCGLFALAFATSLCYSDSPPLLFYHQMSLRNHYVKCIESNTIQPFPSKFKRGSSRKVSKIVDIYLN
ncbi:unnamed protein product [Rotaria sp. Silwood2]|nr:unnamed protein product [Rotaria sp. Silwood2]CAF2967386.1 unnamed protein product [Rotaria sp. Silwood2]CAF3314510.1 unnamed protein product [Rotaria sp. Silwood2]CAF4133072.1 unnamed protein product [Rotaria sp. Silwood2]CAF4206533.1 unnamed protein product [Rotaria sp. Silwood2]